MRASFVPIEIIRDKIPPILYSKLMALNIRDLGQVLAINPDEFLQRPGVGISVKDKLIELQELIKNDLDQFESLYAQKTKVSFLPINQKVAISADFLTSMYEIVNDYMKLLPIQYPGMILIHQYGIKKAEKQNMSELGRALSLTKERVRQIRNIMLGELTDLFKGGFNLKYQCQVREESVKKFDEIRSYLANKRVFEYSEMIEIFRKNFACYNAAEQPDIIDLFIDIAGFVRCRSFETLFTEADLVITDKADRKEFLKVAEDTIRFLKQGVLSYTVKEIVENIRESTNDFQLALIKDALRILPEVEQINRGNSIYYQLRFRSLSSAADKAYRVLSEKGKPLHIEDMAKEINRLHYESGITRTYNRNSLVISTDGRFAPIAKTGYWTLKEWNRNIDKLEDLVKNALLKLNKPSDFESIYQEILTVRPEVSKKSVLSTIGRHCIKVSKNQWLLQEWSQNYPDLPLAKRRKRKIAAELPYRAKQRAQIINYLINKEGKKALASQIIRDLSILDEHYTIASFYKIFDDGAYFDKEASGRITIKLRE